jgi:ribosome-binding ATPase YchF (GTP1/OBG family)
VALGSTAEARRHGRLRSEGRSYVVQDGDVLEVLFSR